MKYHGFDIEPVYLPGSDFHICDNGVIQKRIPKRWHIDYFTLTQYDGSWSHANCGSIPEAKQLIDALHDKLAAHGFTL